jgi:plastocyanin
MQRTLILAATAVLALATTANAGSIQGKVSGVSGPSVVYVDAIAGKTFSPPTAHAVMDQKGLRFQPHLLIVQQGATVDFLNSDTVSHNVAWTLVTAEKRIPHNLGTWPKGEKRSYQFATPGVEMLTCYIHPEMLAYIVVSPTPYYAETEKSGDYKIDNIPDGSYTVVAWHERAPSQSKAVTVSGDSPTNADFTLIKSAE